MNNLTALNIGIGDLITSKSYLLSQANNHPINICLSTAHANYRGPGHIQFAHEFMKLIFHEPNFRISDPIHIEPTHWIQLSKKYNQQIVDLSTILPNNRKPVTVSSPYVCIFTKVRQIHYSHWITVKQAIINQIAYISKRYTILLMGEREIERNLEYQIHDTTVFSIYNDLIELLPKTSYIDITVPSLGITTPDINKIRTDCTYLRDAAATINIGCGGNLSLSGSVGKTINYLGPDTIMDGTDIVPVIKGMFGPKVINCTNLDEFSYNTKD